MAEKMMQHVETNIRNQIFQSLFLVQFCLMQDQKKYYILVQISRTLALISNVLIRNISCAGIR